MVNQAIAQVVSTSKTVFSLLRFYFYMTVLVYSQLEFKFGAWPKPLLILISKEKWSMKLKNEKY